MTNIQVSINAEIKQEFRKLEIVEVKTNNFATSTTFYFYSKKHNAWHNILQSANESEPNILLSANEVLKKDLALHVLKMYDLALNSRFTEFLYIDYFVDSYLQGIEVSRTSTAEMFPELFV